MNPKKFFLLFLGLCGLIFLFWPQPRDSSPDPVNIPRPEKPLFSDAPEDLQGIYAYRSGSGTFLRLEKESPMTWKMNDPVVDRADFGIVRQALLQIFSAPWRDAPDSIRAQSDAQLGLSPARLTLRLQFSGHESELLIGAATLERGHRIARLNGILCLIPISISSWFERNPLQWRDHAALIAPQSVKELLWAPQEGVGFHLQRQGSGWQVLSPLSGPLNPLLESNLQLFLSARCDSLPVDALPADSKTAIRENTGILKVIYSDRAKAQGVLNQTLAITTSLILDIDRDFHLPVRPEFFRFLDTPTQQLVSPRLLRLDSSHVISMKVTGQKGTVVLRRTAKGWNGDSAELESSKLPRLQDDLHQLLQVEKIDEEITLNRTPDFRLLLSISANPIIRGGEEVEVWDLGEEQYLVRRLSQSGQASVSLPEFRPVFAQVASQ